MSGKPPQYICKRLPIAIILSTLFVAILLPTVLFAQAAPDIIYWVFDVSTADSQFGVWNGTDSKPIGDIFDGRDFEGLACVGNTIYASGGGDGAFISQLVRVTIDLETGTSAVSEIGNIETATGLGFYEVASLAIRSSDNTLWGYAAKPPDDGGASGGIGLIKIDVTTGKAQLIYESDLDVAGLAWIGNTMYLGAGNDVHTWTEGGSISEEAIFSVDDVGEIEALDSTASGNLYIGGDGSPVMEFTPVGEMVSSSVFIVQDNEGNQGDPEALTRCVVLVPTALAEGEEPASPASFQHFFYFPFATEW